MDNFLLKSSLVVMLRQLFLDHSLENRARFVFSTDAVRTHQHNLPSTPWLVIKFGSLQLHPLPKNENRVKRSRFWDPESIAKSWVKGERVIRHYHEISQETAAELEPRRRMRRWSRGAAFEPSHRIYCVQKAIILDLNAQLNFYVT